LPSHDFGLLSSAVPISLSGTRLAELSGNKEQVISKISVYRVLIPFHPLGSLWVGRQKPTQLDSTVVIVETDSGLSGVGESCPIGSVYLPAFAAGLRAGLAEMAPTLLGQDATRVAKIYQTMDAALYGHGYAKAAIDIDADNGRVVCQPTTSAR